MSWLSPANFVVVLSTVAWVMPRMTEFGAVGAKNDDAAEEEVINFDDWVIFW